MVGGERECRGLVALIGIPNSGKSTLFNALTGGNERVANWPGVTVSISTGKIRGGGCLVDLPGLYSLSGRSPEEMVVEEGLLSLKPNVITAIIDGTAPERSLYLLVQVLEAFNGKVIVVVTKSTVSHGLGIHIDHEGLSREFGVEVIPISVLEGVGVEALRTALASSDVRVESRFRVSYGLLEDIVSRLSMDERVAEASNMLDVSPRWLIAQLIYGDEVIAGALRSRGYGDVVESISRAREEARERLGVDPTIAVSASRLSAAEAIARRFIVRRRPSSRYGLLDRALLHPLTGPLTGAIMLFTAFLTAFTVNTGFPLNIVLRFAGFGNAASWLEEHNLAGAIGAIFNYIKTLIPGEGPVWSVVGGVIDGVGLVASFIPLIAVVTAFLAFLEDSGLLTRIAVSMHPFISKFGLTGRSVYPLFISFGCNVPGVFSTRILLPHERIRVIAAIPYLICSARLVVLTAFTYALFHSILSQALAATSLYILSIITALLASRLLAFIQHRREGAEEEPPLIMDLPYMHKPSGKVIWWMVRSSLAHFIRKMFGPILIAAVLIGLLLSYGPEGYVGDGIEDSYGAILGSAVGKLLEPIGVGGDERWILGLSLVTGSLVKEVILETIGIATGEVHPVKAVETLSLTPSQAYAFLAFSMLYIPCIGTITAMYTETRSLKMTVYLAALMIAIATAIMYAAYTILEVAGL